MIRIAVCDDNASDRAAARALLEEWAAGQGQESQIIEYERGEGLLYDYQDQAESFSLILLDIFLPGLSGMETARELRTLSPDVPLVFFTTTADFAVESYDVAAAGYLLKPLDRGRARELLDRVLGQKAVRRLEVRTKGCYQYLDHESIMYAESSGRRVTLHLAEGEPLEINQKLDDLEARLNDTRFLRCHQSFLVNMEYIRQVDRDFTLQDGSIIQIRSRNRKELKERYFNYYVKRSLGEEK